MPPVRTGIAAMPIENAQVVQIPEKKMKLCKDCLYAKRHWLFGWEFAKCHAPQLVTIELVTGKKEFGQYCVNQRKFDFNNACGRSAKHFQPKGLHNAN